MKQTMPWRLRKARAKLRLMRAARKFVRLPITVGDWLVGLLVGVAFVAMRAMPTDRASALGGALARWIGPKLPVNRIAADNIACAFPELGAAERAEILRQSWDNLGRMAFEYAHIDRIAAFDLADPENSRIKVPPETVAGFMRMRDDGLPALIFAAHLANWELPAVVAASQGMEATALYRTPNNRFVARRILRLRSGLMGQLVSGGRDAPFQLAAALGRGRHVGMLVDQRFGRGVKVPFFGRPATTNTLLARLARHVDCPVYGVRAIRLPNSQFRMELTGPIDLPRDPDGQIDLAGAMAAITAVVEGWVRDQPGQWLWMHRRWRM
jgi:KDO2-lipid IV(A) lauroyltransferase